MKEFLLNIFQTIITLVGALGFIILIIVLQKSSEAKEVKETNVKEVMRVTYNVQDSSYTVYFPNDTLKSLNGGEYVEFISGYLYESSVELGYGCCDSTELY